MNKENKTPLIRFKGFSDDWEQRKFSDITYLSGKKNKENLPYESYSVTKEQGFIPQNEQFENGGTMATADKTMYYIVSPNSFAYNPARINIGSIGYYENHENVIVSSLYEVFKTTLDVNDKFLWHWFKSEAFQKMIEKYQEGGVRLYFYYDKLCMCSLPMPSLAEQTKIGSYFQSLDNLITLHQRKCESLKKVKKSMLQKMFPKNGESVPEIRFAGFTDAWEQRKLGEVCEITMGQSPDGATYSDSPSKYILVQGNADLKDGWVYPRIWTTQKTRTASAGDLIMSVRAPAGAMGKTAYDIVIGRGVAGIKGNEFVFQQLVKMDSDGYWKKLAAGSTFESINSDIVKNAQIIIPKNIAEQAKIGSYFQSLDNLITLHQRKVEKLKNLKKSMLQKMFV